MPSPFGLAYGIGAGLSNLPGAIQQGRLQALDIATRNMQLQKAQKEQADQQAYDQVMSENVAPPMEEVPVYETKPGPESFDPEMAPEIQGLGTGESAVPTKVKTGVKQQPKQFVSPYERQAYELSQRAQRLRQLGLGSLAFKMEESAVKYGELANDEFGAKAATAVMFSPKDAPALLARLGIEADEVGSLDKDTYYFRKEGQEPILIPREYLAALASGAKKLPDVLARMDSLDYKRWAEGKKMSDWIKQEEIRQSNRLALLAQKNKDRAAGANSATVTSVKAMAESLLNSGQATNIIEAEALAWDRIKPSLEARGDVNPRDRYKAAERERLQIIKEYGPTGPDPKKFPEEAKRFKELSDIVSAPPAPPAVRRPTTPPTAKPTLPSSVPLSKIKEQQAGAKAVKYPDGRVATVDEVVAKLKAKGVTVDMES